MKYVIIGLIAGTIIAAISLVAELVFGISYWLVCAPLYIVYVIGFLIYCSKKGK